MKRVFLIVLDSFGIGEMPDAERFLDKGSNTLKAVRNNKSFNCPNMAELGLFNIEGVSGGLKAPKGSFARLFELSMGKDTTIGHWEIAGIVSDDPLPTYPNGFPEEIIKEFERQTGRKAVCNLPYSGTEVIKDYGEHHIKTGDLIVYTSADSVFQIAAHEDIVPVDELYRYCEIARNILVGKHGVGRIIARPFTGSYPFTRTANRHDFSLLPPSTTMLDLIKDAGLDMISVGKIYDVFAGQGITESIKTQNNADGMAKTKELQARDFNGLCFTNLVDFDMKFGHRNDIDGYAKALTEFDNWLGTFIPDMRDDDVLIITADHGCDPATPSTDHSREYVPMLAYGKNIKSGVDLGTRHGFCDISATVLEYLGVDKGETKGNSFFGCIKEEAMSDKELITAAAMAREKSYSPYSGYKVGAALLTRDGKLYTGCNIENAAFSPTVCAERTAFFKAVSEGETDFARIAIVGGKGDELSELCTPCGVCRQVMAEFCKKDFKLVLGTPDNFKEYSLEEMLPYSFTSDEL